MSCVVKMMKRYNVRLDTSKEYLERLCGRKPQNTTCQVCNKIIPATKNCYELTYDDENALVCSKRCINMYILQNI